MTEASARLVCWLACCQACSCMHGAQGQGLGLHLEVQRVGHNYGCANFLETLCAVVQAAMCEGERVTVLGYGLGLGTVEHACRCRATWRAGFQLGVGDTLRAVIILELLRTCPIGPDPKPLAYRTSTASAAADQAHVSVSQVSPCGVQRQQHPDIHASSSLQSPIFPQL